MPATVERKFALIKIRSGDYLLPSNDGQRLWRIFSHMDGPSYGIADWPSDRKVWVAAAFVDPWEGTYSAPQALRPEHLDEPDRWAEEASTLPTRQAAIDYAIRTVS